MQLAILSDIHDHVWNLQAALTACRDAESLLCCGDLCSPFIIHMLATGFSGPIHIVFGNNDGDHFRITQNAAKYGGRVRLHGEFADLAPEQFGRRIAITHYPDIAEAIAASGEFDLVCYGHDHTLRVDINTECTSLINPGALMGFNPGIWQDVPATFIRLDTESMTGFVVEAGPNRSVSMNPIGRSEAVR